MPRPRKYIEGPPITTMSELAVEIEAGRYVIIKHTKQRVHPSWAASWQFRMAMSAVKSGRLLRALPNPEHKDNKENP